ncbi:MAG TPA: hypothetical protein VI997_04620 [Candidatus Thermoplasmatota archaeon]|nr:hypothetical protein [Candidatus Thermoplasmatota archaeon]
MPTNAELLGGVLTIVAALGVATLGVLVWRVGPERPANRAFAVLSVVYGYTRLVPGLGPILQDFPEAIRAIIIFGIPPVGLLLGAMVWFASVHPRPRGLAARPWGASVLVAASFAASLALVPAAAASEFDGTRLFGPIVIVPALSAVFSVCVAFAFAFEARRTDGASLRLLAVAFSLYPAALAAGALSPTGGIVWQGVALVLETLCGVGSLGVAAVLAWHGGVAGRLAAVAVLLFLAASTLFVGSMPANVGPPAAVARLGLPVLVAYALVRQRLFDVDVKIKWTIKRGTLAAVFLAVFFVVAQLAQTFFTESYGLVVGGVAAGLLLFAIAPLQRMAERVADRAMPGVTDLRALAEASGKEEAYRAALEMALADRVITRHEERALAKLAHELGIPGPRALDLREEAERASSDAARGDRAPALA